MILFAWNETNIEHIAKHGVAPSEAESVVRAARPPYPEQRENEKFLVWGQTDAGRWLQVIFVYLNDDQVEVDDLSLDQLAAFAEGAEVIRVVHARPLIPAEKHRARKRGKGR
jgi:uncharacterized DUF497 family protein